MGHKDKKADIYEVIVQEPRIDLIYPQVKLRDKKAQKRINEAIKTQVYDLIYGQGFYENPTTAFTGRSKVTVNRDGVLSVRNENYAMPELAAHGLTVIKSLTFNLDNGMVYPFEDLFIKGSDYVARINNIIKREIQVREIPLIAEFKTISPNQDYYLTNDSLVIYFQLYQYAPYVYGILEFPIPYRSMVDIVNPRGPIGKLMGD